MHSQPIEQFYPSSLEDFKMIIKNAVARINF
jgi:hypothetical protein